VRDELNVRKVEFKDDVREFTNYTFKPQLKTVGPKYGRLLGKIKQALAEINGNEAMDTLKETGSLKFDLMEIRWN
jgi:isoleucyl-tRNA synthetase